MITEGSGIEVTGSGSAASPYVVSSAGNATQVADTPTIDMTLTGTGLSGDPYIISGAVKLDPNAGNLLAATASGLFLDCAAVAACVSAGVTEVMDTNSIDLTLTGAGTLGDPYVISAVLNLDPAGLGTIGGAGLLISCDDVRSCLSGGSGISFDAGTGIISAAISADSGNTIGFGGDGGLYAPVGGCPDPMTILELMALQTAGTLDPCTTYQVTDWSTPNALPGPNILIAHALSATELSPDVLVQTPLTNGPDRGTYVWGFGMVMLADPLGNEVHDLLHSTIDHFPWALGWSWNYVENSILGGYAANAAAATAGLVLSENRIVGCAFDFSGITTASSISYNTMVGVQLTSGREINIAVCDLGNSGIAACTITNTSTTQQISILGCSLYGGAYTASSTAALYLTGCDFSGASAISATGVSQLTLNRVSGQSATVTDATTGSQVHDDVTDCIINNSALTFTGAPGSAAPRAVNRCRLDGESTLAVTVAAAAVATAAQNTDVANHSTLNVASAGSILDSRVGAAGILNTGAFTHTAVAYEFNGTTTLTAANTGTYKGFGASNVV